MSNGISEQVGLNTPTTSSGVPMADSSEVAKPFLDAARLGSATTTEDHESYDTVHWWREMIV